MNGYLEREDIARCVYQGSRGFEGNQAHKLLMKIDILERDIMKMDLETIHLYSVLENLRKLSLHALARHLISPMEHT